MANFGFVFVLPLRRATVGSGWVLEHFSTETLGGLNVFAGARGFDFTSLGVGALIVLSGGGTFSTSKTEACLS